MKYIGTIIKVLILIALIMAVVFLVLQCSGGSCIKRIDKTEPEVISAPWEVYTPTHHYLADNVTETKTGIIMKGWYERIDDKWVKHKDTIELPFSIYGKIKYGRR